MKMKRIFLIILGTLIIACILSSTLLNVYLVFKVTNSQQNATATDEPTASICVSTPTPTQEQLINGVWRGKITIPPEALRESMLAIIDNLNDEIFSYITLCNYEYNVHCRFQNGTFVSFCFDNSFDEFMNMLEQDIIEGFAQYLSQTDKHTTITHSHIEEIANHVVWFDGIELYYSLNRNKIDFREWDGVEFEDLTVQELTKSVLVFTSSNGCTASLSKPKQ